MTFMKHILNLSDQERSAAQWMFRLAGVVQVEFGFEITQSAIRALAEHPDALMMLAGMEEEILPSLMPEIKRRSFHPGPMGVVELSHSAKDLDDGRCETVTCPTCEGGAGLDRDGYLTEHICTGSGRKPKSRTPCDS